jgi:hypothetical protein
MILVNISKSKNKIMFVVCEESVLSILNYNYLDDVLPLAASSSKYPKK